MLGGCNKADPDADRPETAREFPRPDREVSALGDNAFSTEAQRDSVNEAQQVMDMARIQPGMTVADIGAGEGYYTVRLAERVGKEGRVVAQDIDEEALRQLGIRIERERLDNVSIRRGAADDPRLPAASFDRVFLVHMYHEVTEPYAFLWRLRDAMRPDGKIIVVETDRPSGQHGLPPTLLFCEFKAVGYELGAFVQKPEINGYYARFELGPKRPEPSKIRPCRASPEVAAAVG
ncbi:MAG: class I SAM-dependent methyltransferase [Novosphingobium sp.]|nr:class I SAM-dependent methyltransferase [Novosphingobium sp.]